MRAFVITGPGEYGVQDLPPPTAGPDQVVVDVERAGVCGTDVEFFTGEMAYLHQGHARFPMRIGHEWCGTVSAVGGGAGPHLVQAAGDGADGNLLTGQRVEYPGHRGAQGCRQVLPREARRAFASSGPHEPAGYPSIPLRPCERQKSRTGV